MGEPILAFIALAGSAWLGFLFCATLCRNRMRKLTTENYELKENLKVKKLEFTQLIAESETKMMAIENLQKILQNIENQAIEKDAETKELHLENQKLREEVQYLLDNPIERIREIDVVREVPVLVLREINMPETRKEKAKKLMKAFTKGYLDENGLLQEMIKEELEDNEA